MLKQRTGQGPRAAGPPRLDLRLWRRAKMLVLLNCLPLLVGGVIALGWWQGRLTLRAGSGQSLVALGAMLGACVLFAVAMWVLLPIARWLRDYPLWHVRNGSALRWFVPTVLGTLAWIGLGMAGIAAALAALALLGSGVIRLLRG